MKLLLVTNMLPSEQYPRNGTFVQQQIYGLHSVGVDGEVLHLNRVASGMSVYFKTTTSVCEAIDRFHPDLIHAMCVGGLPF